MRFHHLILSVIIGGLIIGCVDRIDLFSDSTPLLVVDGTLTNEEGPHIINISFAAAFNQIPDYQLVDEAEVIILDDLGNEEPLYYVDRGVFKTSNAYKGEIGRSYQLKVSLASGETYQSNFEKMLDVAPIKEARYSLKGDSIIFSIDFEDIPNEENFYRWRYQGTYQVLAPETRNPLVSPTFTGPCRVRPDKKAADCWAKDFDRGYLNVSHDKLFDGTAINDFEIYSRDIEEIRFAIGYSALISQFSLSKEALSFWQKIAQQLGNNGSIFDASSYLITGNVNNVSKPKEAVLGYFGVSAVSSQRLFISNDELDFEYIYDCEPADVPGACVRVQCYDCRSHSGSSVVDRPEFWPEE